MKRMMQAVLFAALLTVGALSSPHEARGVYVWRTVTVDATGDAGEWSSLAVDDNGDPMISHYRSDIDDLKFAICDRSASTNKNCDQPGDWSTVTVDSAESVGNYSSIAVDGNGDPMISYQHWIADVLGDLKFAICDRSASTNGDCDQADDWSTVTVEAGGYVGYSGSMALNASGDPAISHYDAGNEKLKFAICDRSASANGNCDQPGDWSSAEVDAGGEMGSTSIAVDANGDPMISYYDSTNQNLRFAICDVSASANGNCDQAGDWTTVAADGMGAVVDPNYATSIAVNANGDPVISYYEATNQDLKFAICDRFASTNGNCDQAGDWSTVTVDSAGSVGSCSSIAVDGNGDPIVSYYDETNGNLNWGKCDLSASANGNCDQGSDWRLQTVDAEGHTGLWCSIAADANDEPVISYYESNEQDLKFAIRSAAPVGGIAELPNVSGSSGRNYVAIAGLAAAALLALTAGGWYARRRWVR